MSFLISHMYDILQGSIYIINTLLFYTFFHPRFYISCKICYIYIVYLTLDLFIGPVEINVCVLHNYNRE